jgi:hypothetical protein
MFTADDSPVSIEYMPVGVASRLAKGTNNAGGFIPAQYPVVWDVAPE